MLKIAFWALFGLSLLIMLALWASFCEGAQAMGGDVVKGAPSVSSLPHSGVAPGIEADRHNPDLAKGVQYGNLSPGTMPAMTPRWWTPEAAKARSLSKPEPEAPGGHERSDHSRHIH